MSVVEKRETVQAAKIDLDIFLNVPKSFYLNCVAWGLDEILTLPPPPNLPTPASTFICFSKHTLLFHAPPVDQRYTTCVWPCRCVGSTCISSLVFIWHVSASCGFLTLFLLSSGTSDLAIQHPLREGQKPFDFPGFWGSWVQTCDQTISGRFLQNNRVYQHQNWFDPSSWWDTETLWFSGSRHGIQMSHSSSTSVFVHIKF